MEINNFNTYPVLNRLYCLLFIGWMTLSILTFGCGLSGVSNHVYYSWKAFIAFFLLFSNIHLRLIRLFNLFRGGRSRGTRFRKQSLVNCHQLNFVNFYCSNVRKNVMWVERKISWRTPGNIRLVRSLGPILVPLLKCLKRRPHHIIVVSPSSCTSPLALTKKYPPSRYVRA